MKTIRTIIYAVTQSGSFTLSGTNITLLNQGTGQVTINNVLEIAAGSTITLPLMTEGEDTTTLRIDFAADTDRKLVVITRT